MTTITIFKNKTKNINKIIISGHSGYGPIGKDIVCSSVSSIIVCTVNGLLLLREEIECSESDGFVEIKVLKESYINQTLLKNMINIFYDLKDQYKDNINIVEENEIEWKKV